MIKADFVNPFIIAAYDVFDALMEVKVDKGRIWTLDTSMTSSEVNVLVGVTGSVYGQIVYGMSQHTAKLIASHMIEQPVRILNDLAQSAIGELGNMISGHTVANIEQKYPNIVLNPPHILVGQNILIATINVRRLYVELISEIGTIEVSIAMGRRPIPNALFITYHNETTMKLLG